MQKKMTKFFVLVLATVFLASFGFSQVDFTLFGLYNLNLSYPSTVELDSDVEAVVSSFYDEWQAFFDAALEQNGGIGFGGRIAFNITPAIGIEGSLEYIMAETSFTEGIVDDLLDKMESIGYGDFMEIANESGGNIMRYYGNVVFNIPSPGNMTPYITAGIGITQFKITEEVGPEILADRPGTQETVHIFYENASALTFNGGGGIKALFTPNIGLRIDARVFYCNPEFQQKFYEKFWGVVIFNEIDSLIQSGAHIDANLNVGFFARF